MKVEQFNDKYKEYLCEGHCGLDIDCQEAIDYLDSVFPDLIKNIPDFKYYQIKIKLGYVCLYADIPNEQHTVIRDTLQGLVDG